MSEKPDVLDLNKIKPPERKVKLKDKEINTSQIPASVSLEIIENYEKLQEEDPESLEILFDIVMNIIDSQNDDEEITKDWLLENTNFDQLYRLIDFIMEPIQNRVEEEAENQGN